MAFILGAMFASTSVHATNSISVVGFAQSRADVQKQTPQTLQQQTLTWLQENSITSQSYSHLHKAILPFEDGEAIKTKKRLEELRQRADSLYQMGKLNKSVVVYQELIQALVELQRPSETQITSLRKLRLQTASRLLALGESLTAEQEEVIATLLDDALKANPLMELLPSKYPPVLRKRFARARAHLAENKRVPLFVKTAPSNAIVYVEGRKVGFAPLQLLDALHAGSYRIWAEKDGIRSTTQVVQVHHQKIQLEFDFQTQFRFLENANTFVLPPKDTNFFTFCSGLSSLESSTPILLVGELTERQNSVVALLIDQKEVARFAITAFKEPQERSSALQQSLNVLFHGSPQRLTPDNLIDNQNSSTALAQEADPAISGAAWVLLGTSTVLVLGAITAGFLLWPTQEPQGTLRVEVVP